ncbi:MAG TPA: nitroreductase family protein, partial [Anaerolineales bacterium]|nr:nitroreductase family protein [Anaerolineales bacterium]
MDVFEAIHNRHSHKKVKPDAVPRDLIEKMLEAAAQAPNHYRVRPWRFVVMTGEARHRLGHAMSESLRER